MPGSRLLVVDDHLDTLRLYATYLTLEGFSVTTASSVEEALGLCSGLDALVTDFAMPGMGGAELIRRLRPGRGERTFPIVVVSGQATPRIEKELAALGSCRILRKPCDLSELASLLRLLTSTCRHRCEACSHALAGA